MTAMRAETRPWDTRSSRSVWEPTRNRWYIRQALKRLAITDPDKPKLVVYFADGPSRHATYVAFRDEPEPRIEMERAGGYEISEDGSIREVDVERFAYVFVGMRDGRATYELEVPE